MSVDVQDPRLRSHADWLELEDELHELTPPQIKRARSRRGQNTIVIRFREGRNEFSVTIPLAWSDLDPRRQEPPRAPDTPRALLRHMLDYRFYELASPPREPASYADIFHRIAAASHPASDHEETTLNELPAEAAPQLPGSTDQPSSPTRDQPSVLRVGGLAGIGMIFGGIILLSLSTGAGLLAMYLGLATFGLANYGSYRAGEPNYVIGPSVAAMLTLASLALAIVTTLGLIFR
jgi:hypothetical protein